MISDNTRSEDLRVDYPQQSTRSSGATPIGCTFGAPTNLEALQCKMLTFEAQTQDRTPNFEE
jgi:hypothetical protein